MIKKIDTLFTDSKTGLQFTVEIGNPIVDETGVYVTYKKVFRDKNGAVDEDAHEKLVAEFYPATAKGYTDFVAFLTNKATNKFT